MHQEGKSITTLSKSTTNKNAPSGLPSATPVQFVKGVGPGLASTLNRRDIFTVSDLLQFFPRTYEDRSKIQRISDLKDGGVATLAVRVTKKRLIPIRGRNLLEVVCSNETGQIVLKWFHSPRGIEHRLVQGAELGVSGKVKIFRGTPEIIHPEITFGVSAVTVPAANEEDTATTWDQPGFGRMVPVYVEIEGVPSRSLRSILWKALERFGPQLTEDLPEHLLEKWKLPRIGDAIRDLHFPPDLPTFSLEHLVGCRTPAHARMIYGEFFKFEYLMLRQRLQASKASARSIQDASISSTQMLLGGLPFKLTGAQQKCFSDILKDLSQGHPMSRLVQGDVGSGKTVVAFLACAAVLAHGGQATMMAPTEILAEQHLKSAQKFFPGLNVALLTGKTPAKERARIHGMLSEGLPTLLIGTHAILEESVEFKCLDLVIIDEQHRFGVDQRRILKNKGVREGLQPHFLMMSATPIPRTLALTAFGDLVISSIKEMPPGRTPVITKIARDQTSRVRAYDQIRSELRAGRQAFFIYPLVNDSEAEGFTQLKSAVAEAESLATEVFPEFKVGLLHGQMKNEEKAQVMENFRKGELKILVSTTVVEVGVDVPNATIIAIEHAERFGLSQLHQLRGRVGRGSFQSHCHLLTSAKHETPTGQRLEVLEQTQDGFKIAEADLEIRGPGEFLGIRQSGGLPFKVANLVRDVEWLLRAREDAIAVLKEDPGLQERRHASLSRYFSQDGQRLQTF